MIRKSNKIEFRDEGVSSGYSGVVNFEGNGVSVGGFVGGVARVTIPGGFSLLTFITNITIPAGNGAYVPYRFEISSGTFLDVSVLSAFEIG